MKDSFTVISAPSGRDNGLLSLTESRSRYMLPFGGKFRVVDFTLRNSSAMEAAYTILYTDVDDSLDNYIAGRNFLEDESVAHLVRVVNSTDIHDFIKVIDETDTSHYIIYNGDNPSIIDFRQLTDRFIKKGGDAVLYLIEIDGKATMANKILIVKRKPLIKSLKKAVKENAHAPNIVEMVVNMVINLGIRREIYKTFYWPVNNIPEYYRITGNIIWNPNILTLLYKDRIIKSRIAPPESGYAMLGKTADVTNSFMSDFCHIEGKVENSVIYPGVTVDEKAVVKDSILLPFAHIGRGAKVVRSIVDETTEAQDAPNIGSYCNVGTYEEHLRNGDFPHSIFGSLTLIGKNCRIPERITIGGACYIASNVNEASFEKTRTVNNGVSVYAQALQEQDPKTED